MNRFFNVSLAAFVAISTLSCSKEDEPTGPEGAQIRVLFIGNSLTYTNDLPGMVERVAAAAGESIVTQSIANPGYALIDHWNDGVVQGAIQDGAFDYVVLQQGPSSLPLNRDTLRLAAALLAPVIQEAGGIPALFAVWPEIERYSVFPDVNESYYLAAQDVNGVFLPVGNTWVRTFSARPGAPLYGPDGYHPDVAGTYAAAVVIVSVLTGRDPQTLALAVTGLSLDQGLMEAIHAAARSAISANALQRR
jgi:hypothetical protein